jgi:hypothetical protein
MTVKGADKMNENICDYLHELIDIDLGDDTSEVLGELVFYEFIHRLMQNTARLGREIESLKNEVNSLYPDDGSLGYSAIRSDAFEMIDDDHPTMNRYRELYGHRAIDEMTPMPGPSQTGFLTHR